MNYLELCQRVRQEAGISGNGPTTVLNQQGQLAKVIDWVKSAWLDIQGKRQDWGFLWGTLNFDTAVNEDAYLTGTTDIKRIETLKLYQKTKGIADEVMLQPTSYVDMRNQHKIATEQNGRPVFYAIRPDKAIVLAPTPVEIYTLTLDYYKKPQLLSANADIPYLPEEYEDAIVYRALMMFAAHYEASMQYQDAKIEYDRIMNNLESDQLPVIGLTGPLQ